MEFINLVIICLMLGVLGWSILQWLISYVERCDDLSINGTPMDSPMLRYEIDQTNLDQILALHGVKQADRFDIIKGTKL